MKLGSLFDGSGGFPLAGALCGIEPVWASEIEPYPIAVTRERFPHMKHLGDISKINGAEVEPVDIITFGSPCQDLSIAGKRAGLKHEENGDEETTRSGLFMEAVRIIKEMREATNGKYPRFALWENVPGAFSSNQGKDFGIVLEELIKIVEPSTVMPPVPPGGWAYADCYTGTGWSLAYRVFDAQYWGVPQRRRRIHLIADFRGECAGKILFEREGLRGYFAESRKEGEGITGDAERSTGTADRAGENITFGFMRQLSGVEVQENVAPTILAAAGESGNNKPCVAYTLKIRSGCEGGGEGALIQENMSATLATNNDQYLFQPVAYSFDSLASNSMKSGNPHSGCRQVEVAKTLDTTDPNPCKNQGGIAVVERIVLDDQGGQQINVRTDGKAPTLRAEMHGNVPCVMEAAGFCTEHSAQSRGIGYEEEVAPTPRAGVTPAVVYSIENHPADSRVDIDESGKVQTLTSRMGTGGGNVPLVAEPKPVYSLQGNMIGREDKNAPQGSGINEDVSFTVNTADRHAVAYATDVGFFNTQENVSPTLLARQYKDPHPVTYTDDIHYIVRRLTPTECARLQGFADGWGDIEPKSDFSDEEYRFWLEVRNTHAAINGKQSKEYTKSQMLTWYNKLHTDSAEYKMWGNGIALPPAVYVMEGVREVL